MKCYGCNAQIENKALCPCCSGRLDDDVKELQRQLELAKAWTRTWHNAARKAQARVAEYEEAVKEKHRE